MRNILQCVPANEGFRPPEEVIGYAHDYGLVGPAAFAVVCLGRTSRRGRWHLGFHLPPQPDLVDQVLLIV